MRCIIGIILALVIVAPVAATEPEGPPSCDSSPEVYAECEALANGGVPPQDSSAHTQIPSASPEPTPVPSAAPTTGIPASIAPTLLPDTAMGVGK